MSSQPATLEVSVVIPVYNRNDLLTRAVHSVQTQSVAPAEIVVVDDCSTDGSADVAAELGCVVVRLERNQGAAAARNAGIAAAHHDWIALLDSDDEWLPRHLQTVWAARGTHLFVSSTALWIDRSDVPVRILGPPFWRPRTLTAPTDLLYPENIVAASGALVRKAAVEDVGGYDTALRYSEDFDLWTRLLARGTGCALPDVTVLVQAHMGQKSTHKGGPSAAQRRIAERVQDESGVGVSADRRLGVRAWDDLRRALRDRDRQNGARAMKTLFGRRQRVAGVVGIWIWRRQMRRRARAFVGQGRLRVAVLSLRSGSAMPPSGSDHVIEDWRHYGPGKRLRQLIQAPPRAAVTSTRRDRLLARAMGVAAPEAQGGFGGHLDAPNPAATSGSVPADPRYPDNLQRILK